MAAEDWLMGEDPEEEVYQRGRTKCNKCGATDVYWEKNFMSGKWQLKDSGTLRLHECTFSFDDIPQL